MWPANDVISFEANCRRSDALSSSDHHTCFNDALSGLSNRHVRQGEVVGDAIANICRHQAKFSRPRVDLCLHCFVDVVGDPPGDLG